MRSIEELTKQKTKKLAIVTELQNELNFLLDQVNDGFDRPENINKYREFYTRLELEKALIQRLDRDIKLRKIYDLVTRSSTSKNSMIEMKSIISNLKLIRETESDIPELLKDKIDEEIIRLNSVVGWYEVKKNEKEN